MGNENWQNRVGPGWRWRRWVWWGWGIRFIFITLSMIFWFSYFYLNDSDPHLANTFLILAVVLIIVSIIVFAVIFYLRRRRMASVAEGEFPARTRVWRERRRAQIEGANLTQPMKYCIQCRKQIKDDAIYCEFCGEPQSS
ncbi:MAG TPA: hypothetical protein VMV49_18500 [Candidatus Deferrimicrobium sp.]|nr:hypothetical protein [Candidatus Deferrimicrobium sp.]